MTMEPNNSPSPRSNTAEPMLTTLTLRMIMQGKEAGSIIGKKGDNVKRFREESGARINISDASCPERIVTVAGTTQQIVSAFSMICKRFEEDLQNANPGSANTKQLITMRLIMPATQCGSLIGKGGAKIKEIRDVAGASIQISSEMLPNSTERSVTISGSVDAVTRGISHICAVMLESPPKGAIIPYRPKLAMTPVIVAGGQAFAFQGQYVIPQHDPRAPQQATMVQYQPVPQYAKMSLQHQMLGHQLSPYVTPQTLLAPSPYQALGFSGFIRSPTHGIVQTTQTHEMSIPNDLIGCIIGRGGSKINEIRQLSGANIKIAGAEDGSTDRTVTITGIPESINAAQYLINASLEMHKNLASLTIDPNSNMLPAPPTSSASNLLNSSSFSSSCSAVALASVDMLPEYRPQLPPSSMKAMTFSSLALTAVNSDISSMMTMSPFVNSVAMSTMNLPAPAMVNNSGVFSPMPLAAPQSPSHPPHPHPHPHPIAIPMNTLIKPFPMLSYGGFIGATYLDARYDLATKIKGGIALATTAGRSNYKFSPY